MTKANTIEELQAEVARLKEHAEDLLAERKAEKKRREDAEAQLATLTAERDTLAGQVDGLTLSGPVLRALENVVACAPAKGRQLLEDAGIGFRISKEGTAVAVDGETEVPLPDLWKYLGDKCHASKEGMATFGWFVRGTGASGSGARGGDMPHYTPAKPAEPQKPLVTGLGLR